MGRSARPNGHAYERLPESAGACCTHADNIGDEARSHRDILGTALTAVGLVNYPTEWWHWSHGDRYWVLKEEAAVAHYGPREPH